MERSARFGEDIIELAKKIPQNAVNNRLISQLVGAGTSVAANYCEADDAVSGKEFKQKIGYSRKESKETMLLLRYVAKAEPNLAAEARTLWRDAKERVQNPMLTHARIFFVAMPNGLELPFIMLNSFQHDHL
jgi:four helix bundle protein